VSNLSTALVIIKKKKGGRTKRGHTAILMRPNALIPLLPLPLQRAHVRVLDNLQLVLLVLVKVLIERIRRQFDGLGNQASEVDGNLAHALHVVGIHLAKLGQHGRRRPLVGPQQVVVDGRTFWRRRVLGRQVDLLAVVDGAGRDLGREAAVAEEGGGVFHFDFEPGTLVGSKVSCCYIPLHNSGSGGI
jgi:hypothetical protein